MKYLPKIALTSLALFLSLAVSFASPNEQNWFREQEWAAFVVTGYVNDVYRNPDYDAHLEDFEEGYTANITVSEIRPGNETRYRFNLGTEVYESMLKNITRDKHVEVLFAKVTANLIPVAGFTSDANFEKGQEIKAYLNPFEYQGNRYFAVAGRIRGKITLKEPPLQSLMLKIPSNSTKLWLFAFVIALFVIIRIFKGKPKPGKAQNES